MAAKGQTTLQDFTNLRMIGKGSFGKVYRAKRLSDGNDYALKEVDIRHMTQRQREESVNEVRVLASIQHAKVIRYYEAFVDSDRLYIVTEFARHGDLYAKIKRQQARQGLFDEQTIWSIFIQIAQGLQAIHKKDVIHRDIKTPNIFVSGQIVKIGDLGVAKVMKSGLAHTQIGTPYYMAPEIWRGRAYNKKCDIWSLGCVLYELATLRRPFEAHDERSLARKIYSGNYSQIEKSFSQDLTDLIRSCLAQDSSRRPSISEILDLPCVRKRIDSGLHIDDKENFCNDGKLIGTIRVPRDLKLLSHKLPMPAYSPIRTELPAAKGSNGTPRRKSSKTPVGLQPVQEGKGTPRANRHARVADFHHHHHHNSDPRPRSSPSRLPAIISPRRRKMLPERCSMQEMIARAPVRANAANAINPRGAFDMPRGRASAMGLLHEPGERLRGRRRYAMDR